MIGLDSNILVRYLTQDDPIQSAKATEIIEQRLTEENPGFVSVVAMVETVWVLDRAYGLSNPRNRRGCRAHAPDRRPELWRTSRKSSRAMIALKEGKGSFADAVIAALGSRAGCSCTLTFDRKALRLSGFEFP